MTKTKNINSLNNILKLVLIFVIYFSWSYFVSGVLNLFNLTGVVALSLSLILNFVLLGIIAFILHDILKKEWNVFKKSWKKCIKTGFICLIIGFILYNLSNMLIYSLFPNLENNNYKSLSEIFQSVPVLLLISTLFYYPVIEELVFKTTLKGIIKNKWFFVIFTGLINAFFLIALSSYSNSYMFMYLLPNFTFAATFSYIYYRTDTVFASILARSFYNLIPNLIAIFSFIYL